MRLKLSSVETLPQVSSLETSPQASIWILRLMWIQLKWLCPPHQGEEDIIFGADPVCVGWRQRGLFEELHLRNLWVDSDQTCMVTSPWWRKAVFRFWWPWPHLQGHSPQTVNFGPKWRICSLSMKFGHSQEGALIYLKTFFLSFSLAFSDSYSSQRRTEKTFFRFGRIRFHPATELCPSEGSTLFFLSDQPGPSIYWLSHRNNE